MDTYDLPVTYSYGINQSNFALYRVTEMKGGEIVVVWREFGKRLCGYRQGISKLLEMTK